MGAKHGRLRMKSIREGYGRRSRPDRRVAEGRGLVDAQHLQLRAEELQLLERQLHGKVDRIGLNNCALTFHDEGGDNQIQHGNTTHGGSVSAPHVLALDAYSDAATDYPSAVRILLDWLAAEFVESGWDVKHMLSILFNSRAYRQE